MVSLKTLDVGCPPSDKNQLKMIILMECRVLHRAHVTKSYFTFLVKFESSDFCHINFDMLKITCSVSGCMNGPYSSVSNFV